jgi:hypothetical protein
MKWYLVYVGLALGLLVFIVWYRSRTETFVPTDVPIDIFSEYQSFVPPGASMDIPFGGTDIFEDASDGGTDAQLVPDPLHLVTDIDSSPFNPRQGSEQENRFVTPPTHPHTLLEDLQGIFTM